MYSHNTKCRCFFVIWLLNSNDLAFCSVPRNVLFAFDYSKINPPLLLSCVMVTSEFYAVTVISSKLYVITREDSYMHSHFSHHVIVYYMSVIQFNLMRRKPL